jgi:hypothetical protein
LVVHMGISIPSSIFLIIRTLLLFLPLSQNYDAHPFQFLFNSDHPSFSDNYNQCLITVFNLIFLVAFPSSFAQAPFTDVSGTPLLFCKMSLALSLLHCFISPSTHPPSYSCSVSSTSYSCHQILGFSGLPWIFSF